MNGPMAESSASIRDSTLYLRHILQAVGRIESYAVVAEAVVRAESMRQDAIVRNLEIIGETVRRLPATVQHQLESQATASLRPAWFDARTTRCHPRPERT